MLHDHFHPPLKNICPWTGFHSHWAGNLATAINRVLPEGWVAYPTVHWDIEVDVAAFEKRTATETASTRSSGRQSWPEPLQTIDFGLTTDIVEVRVYRDLGELSLAGAVEFVSPANKDRPENRDAFLVKCDAYLRDRVGLVMVDIVTNRHANLHTQLMERFGETNEQEANLYVAAYRPFAQVTKPSLSIWYRTLQLGGELPMMLLFLKDGPVVELPLDHAYSQTCTDLKISSE